MGLSTRFKLYIKSVLSATSPFTGGGYAEVDLDDILGSGTGADTADKCSTWTTSTATNADVDIRSQVDSNGVACDFAEIVCMVISCPTTNGGDIEIKPAASNGWVSFLNGSTNKIIIPKGGTVVLYCPPAAAWAMGASTDTINVASSSGTSAATFTVIGRSA